MRILVKDIVNKEGQKVELMGWVSVRRDHGKLIFIDLRDRSGICQLVFVGKALYEKADKLRSEWVVKIVGQVNKRPPAMVNKDLPTGEYEVLAEKLEVLNEAKTPPFEVGTDGTEVGEDVRMKYRYIDLRRQRLQKNIRNRDKVIAFMRNFLRERDFVEVETPILSKSTPEGARDYLVPSRLYNGKFYALPQSPQQYKQLLMVAGMERYFQVARCFRDEDTRGDRQPEFTQLDLEMSFVREEDVMSLIEEMFIKAVQTLYPGKKIQQMPFPRMSYKEAMEKYGTDRPDLRETKDDPNLLAFCWVVDFPFFEKTDERWTFTHNPFSSPKPEHVEWLMEKKNIGEILTTQYDIVLNGFEVGGGSIRNHQPEALKKVFEIMGLAEERIMNNFGHMLEALGSGAPPHGGIAPGLDRLIMILENEPNIREVIAFPKTGDARDLMMEAPSEVSKEQLKELGLEIKKKK
ncbi:MAG: aspartate--tRNA ligase [Candidatus Harrisonbacteria bacterium]|nr:aspartate--tRNA ligase [Candidatus Harrisonbacteria bacterium]